MQGQWKTTLFYSGPPGPSLQSPRHIALDCLFARPDRSPLEPPPPFVATGTLNGRFYGPDASELGAAWYAHGQDAGRYVRLNTDGAFTLNFDFTANSMKGALNGAIVGTERSKYQAICIPLRSVFRTILRAAVFTAPSSAPI